MTSINKKYFKNAELYGKAMELLAQWEYFKEQDFDAADHFLANLEKDEISLIKRAEKQNAEDRGFIYQESSFKQLKTAPVDVKNDPFLKELIEIWLLEKRKKLKPSSFESDKSKMEMFSEILKELGHASISIADLNVGILRSYIDTIQNLPAVRNSTSLLNKKFIDLAKLDVEKISSKTFKYNLRTVSGFLNWVTYKGYDIDPKLKVILEGSLKNTVKEDRSKRVPFDDDDLKAMFLSFDYIRGAFKRSSDYWVPLIALFTGARLGEIAQLTVNDIKNIDGQWVFDINEEGEGKSIKNKTGSKRIIPIHRQLINLKFIEFVDHIKKNNESRLFFDEQRSIEGKFAQLQKRISYFIKHVAKVESTRENTKVFHSFRHLVRTKLVEAGVDERVIDSIVGHSNKDRSVGSTHYTHSDYIQQKIDAMKKLKYDLDLKEIRRWDYCRFVKFINTK